MNALQNYLVRHPLPACEPNEEFTTDFTPFLSLPGFFPGAGGFFHGHPPSSIKVLIFGTDFGPLWYQRDLDKTGGEPASNPTIANLAKLLQAAGVPLAECFMTNAVLCMWSSDNTVGNHQIWRKYPSYIQQCASWHQRFIEHMKPTGVVLMGAPALETTGKMLFPGLAQHWEGMSKMKQVYEAGREIYQAPNGPKVLLIPHTSYWHINGRQLGAKAIDHLKNMAQ